MQKDIQKITANLPPELLKEAMRITGKGVTETLREGLQSLTRDEAYREFAKLRGKVKTKYTWQKVKEDRE